MFAKVFASLWEGSMVGAADAQLVFVFILAHADADGCVDKTPEVIAALTGLSLERVRAALEVLCGPDPRSRSRSQHGRRLVPLDPERDWGWRVVNYAHYRGLRDAEQRREQNREAARRYRSRQAGTADDASADISRHQPRQAQGEGEGEGDPSSLRSEGEPERPGASGCTRPALAVTANGTPTLTDTHGGAETRGTPTTGRRSRAPRARSGAQESLPVAGDQPPGPERGPERALEVWPPEPPFIELPGLRGPWPVSRALVRECREAFPAVDVERELREMRLWLAANPTKRKTPRGMPSFVQRWLAREQDRGGTPGTTVPVRRGTGPAPAPLPPPLLTAEERAEALSNVEHLTRSIGASMRMPDGGRVRRDGRERP